MAMSDYIITCCSTADLPYEYMRARNVPYVIYHFNMDGKDYPDDLGQTVPFDEFYRRIAQGALPTTSQVNVGEFIAFFEPMLQQGKDILHISMSSALSGTYNSACVARDELSAKYPGRTLYIVDTRAASSGYGLLVDAALDLREGGAPIGEVHGWVEGNKLNVHHWFFTTDLTHLKRGGRISPSSAFVGTLLGICPLMNVNPEGRLIPRKKVRGKKHVIEETLATMPRHANGGTAYEGKCFISHSAAYDDARALADLVEQTFPRLHGKVMINSVGTVIGSHTGPGTVALFFFGDARTD
jgi:DegV family protein with EDD domain